VNKFSVGHLADCGGRAREVYDAEEVDTRIAELEKGLRAALRWLDAPVSKDVVATDLPPATAGFTGEYLNDLADMRAAARSL
jgi:hypothetical protein